MLSSSIAERIDTLLDKKLATRTLKNDDLNQWRGERKPNNMIYYELMHLRENKLPISYVILIALSYFKDETPWLYDIGKYLLEYIQSDTVYNQKSRAIKEFSDIIDYSFHSLINKEPSNERRTILYELPRLYLNYLDTFTISKEENREKEQLSTENNSRQRINKQSKENISDDK
jgi:hypothetical protein